MRKRNKRSREEGVLSNFLFQRALINFNINVVMNFIIQYFALRNYETLLIFGGKQSVVKLFLPFSFFLPFFVTMDAVKHVVKRAKKRKLPILFLKGFKWAPHAGRMGLQNGVLSLLVTWGFILSSSMLLPYEVAIDRSPIMGVLVFGAGILAFAFTYQPIYELRKKGLIKVENSRKVVRRKRRVVRKKKRNGARKKIVRRKMLHEVVD